MRDVICCHHDVLLLFVLGDLHAPPKCSDAVTGPQIQIKYNTGCPMWETTSRQRRWDACCFGPDQDGLAQPAHCMARETPSLRIKVQSGPILH